MGNTNIQNTLSKKKKQTKVICYISLVVLNILLFLPIVGKIMISEDEDEKPSEKSQPNVVMVLNCNSVDETINSTFLNGNPQNFLYKIKGNLKEINNPDEEEITSAIDESDENDRTTDNDNIDNNIDENVDSDENQNESSDFIVVNPDASLYETFSNLSEALYDEEENVTSIQMDAYRLAALDIYSSSLETIDKQEVYFKSRGFNCTKATY